MDHFLYAFRYVLVTDTELIRYILTKHLPIKPKDVHAISFGTDPDDCVVCFTGTPSWSVTLKHFSVVQSMDARGAPDEVRDRHVARLKREGFQHEKTFGSETREFQSWIAALEPKGQRMRPPVVPPPNADRAS